MEQADVRRSWKLRLEVRGVVLEELESVGERLGLVDKVDIDKDVNIKLFVSPVNLEQGLESSQEHVCLIVC